MSLMLEHVTFGVEIDRSGLIDPSRIPVLWLLIAFVITAVTTRIITRRIRAEP